MVTTRPKSLSKSKICSKEILQITSQTTKDRQLWALNLPKRSLNKNSRHLTNFLLLTNTSRVKDQHKMKKQNTTTNCIWTIYLTTRVKLNKQQTPNDQRPRPRCLKSHLLVHRKTYLRNKRWLGQSQRHVQTKSSNKTNQSKLRVPPVQRSYLCRRPNKNRRHKLSLNLEVHRYKAKAKTYSKKVQLSSKSQSTRQLWQIINAKKCKNLTTKLLRKKWQGTRGILPNLAKT